MCTPWWERGVKSPRAEIELELTLIWRGFEDSDTFLDKIWCWNNHPASPPNSWSTVHVKLNWTRLLWTALFRTAVYWAAAAEYWDVLKRGNYVKIQKYEKKLKKYNLTCWLKPVLWERGEGELNLVWGGELHCRCWTNLKRCDDAEIGYDDDGDDDKDNNGNIADDDDHTGTNCTGVTIRW